LAQARIAGFQKVCCSLVIRILAVAMGCSSGKQSTQKPAGKTTTENTLLCRQGSCLTADYTFPGKTDVVNQLKQRFPDASPQTIADALDEAGCHAGRAAAALREGGEKEVQVPEADQLSQNQSCHQAASSSSDADAPPTNATQNAPDVETSQAPVPDVSSPEPPPPASEQQLFPGAAAAMAELNQGYAASNKDDSEPNAVALPALESNKQPPICSNQRQRPEQHSQRTGYNMHRKTGEDLEAIIKEAAKEPVKRREKSTCCC